MTLRAQALALAAALLLTGCTSPTADTQTVQPQPVAASESAASVPSAKDEALGSSWTGQAGDLEIQVAAPATVPAGEFYPIEVTYTNTGAGAVELKASSCPIVYDIREEPSGKLMTRDATMMVHCAARLLAPERLEAGDETSRTVAALILGFPEGQYSLQTEFWSMTNEPYRRIGGEWREHSLNPAPPEVRFEIH